VSIPVPANFSEFMSNFAFPDFSGLTNPKVYTVAIVIAVVASLETLLSLEAADKLDPYKRISPSNRELKAQGIGNIIAGFVGGIPVTQVIVRSSANVLSGGKTKAATILHGVWLLLSIVLIPKLLNQIPLATLASILILVGYKLAKPSLFKEMFKQGWGQFLPFIVTIVAMLFSDLLKGIGLGMVVAVFIILKNNLDIPFKVFRGSVKGKNKIKMSLSEDVSFLNKAAVQRSLMEIDDNTIVEIDATNSHFIHYDVVEIIKDFEVNAISRNITVTIRGLDEVNKNNPIKHFDFELVGPQTKAGQQNLSPDKAQQKLIEGNGRFVDNKKANRDLQDQVIETSVGQFPFGVVLSCIDSRLLVEMIFDQGIGDLFNIKVAGNTVNTDILGSMEYSCNVAGSKIIVVMGHTSCGAINSACKGVELGNITPLLKKIKPAIDKITADSSISDSHICDAVAIENVKMSINEIRQESDILAKMETDGKIKIVGALYDISTGKVSFLD
jgi:MFS superfamily sulfate permease-like transporter